MTFGESYLTHLRCLEDVGMTSIEPIMYEGKEIVPLQFLKAVLPDPSSLGPRTKGKTNIGCIFIGKKDGQEKKLYIYNTCDHQECYKEVGSQGCCLYDRCAGDDRRYDGDDRYMEETGRIQYGRVRSGSRLWMP